MEAVCVFILWILIVPICIAGIHTLYDLCIWCVDYIENCIERSKAKRNSSNMNEYFADRFLDVK